MQEIWSKKLLFADNDVTMQWLLLSGKFVHKANSQFPFGYVVFLNLHHILTVTIVPVSGLSLWVSYCDNRSCVRTEFIVKLPKSRPGNVEYFKLLGWKCDLYGLERQISLVAIKSTLSNFQNPRWQPSDLDFGKIFNF